MEWDVLEHPYFDKHNDWYASVILIAGSIVAVEFFYNSWLLIATTVIATTTFLLLAAHKPDMMHVTLQENGIRAGNAFYLYNTLDGFSVVEHHTENKILLESTKHIMPLIVIPIDFDVPLEEVRSFLHPHIHEKELRESFPHLLLEYFGF